MGLPARISEKIEQADSGCWIWMASRSCSGYGRVRFQGQLQEAYRLVYELLVGPIPDELELDHLCRERACVNPAHLDIVTSRENTLRGEGPTAINARKTRCCRGHSLLDESNIYRKGQSGRKCRACALMHAAQQYAGKRGG